MLLDARAGARELGSERSWAQLSAKVSSCGWSRRARRKTKLQLLLDEVRAVGVLKGGNLGPSPFTHTPHTLQRGAAANKLLRSFTNRSYIGYTNHARRQGPSVPQAAGTGSEESRPRVLEHSRARLLAILKSRSSSSAAHGRAPSDCHAPLAASGTRSCRANGNACLLEQSSRTVLPKPSHNSTGHMRAVSQAVDVSMK